MHSYRTIPLSGLVRPQHQVGEMATFGIVFGNLARLQTELGLESHQDFSARAHPNLGRRAAVLESVPAIPTVVPRSGPGASTVEGATDPALLPCNIL